MLGVITWNKNVKHWQDSYESYSIAFLDLENPEIDTNIVVLQYPQPEIEYMTWSMTSSRDAKMSSVESTVLKVIPLNFSTSKTLETIPIKLLYDFYNPGTIHDTLTSCMTSSRDVKVSNADRTVLEMIPLNFLTSKTLKPIPKKLLYDFYNPRYNTWLLNVMYDIITWRQSVERWSYSLGNDSIEFLDHKNLDNDANKVDVRLLQPEIRYMTL